MPIKIRVAILFICLGAGLSRASGGVISESPIEAPATADFSALKDDFFQNSLSLSPEMASQLGITDSENSRWEDLSPEGIKKQISFFASMEKRLSNTAVNTLSPQDQIDYSVMLSIARGNIHSMKNRKDQLDLGMGQDFLYPHQFILDQISQINAGVPALPIWRNILARTQKIPAYLAQIKGNLETGLQEGRIPDKRQAEQTANGIKDAVEYFQSGIYADAKQQLSPQDLSALEPSLKSAAQAAQAAYQGAQEFLQSLLLPLAQENYALGEKEYAWNLKNVLGVRNSPEQIRHKGLKMAAKIRKRMEALAHEINPDKSLEQTMEDLAQDHPADDQELFAAHHKGFNDAVEFVIRNKIIDIPESFQLKIEPIPKSERPTNAVAALKPPPPLDASKPGVFQINPSEGDPEKLKSHNNAEIPSMDVHEGIGHGLQFAYFQMFNKTISPVRYLMDNDLGEEGWAHYMEELLRKRGFFTRKAELAQLRDQLWYAYRMAVDVGLHTGKMSFQEAVDTLRDKAFLNQEFAEQEVYRYTTDPLQAITYMLGRLQIESLKRKYRRMMGPDYNEAAFHTAYLSFGPVPPALIARVLLKEARHRSKNRLNKS